MSPLVRLEPLDIGIIALFALGILALGFSARLRDNSVLQFLAAGRGLTLPVFVATLVSTWYGGILGIGEAASYYGLGTWLLLGVPYYIFALLYAFFLARRVRAADQISIPERIESRWGRAAGLTGGSLVFLLAVPAAHVLMLGILIQSISGWSTPLSVLIGALGGTLFLYKGGLLADARVSLLAFLMMYVGFGVIVGYCLLNYPPGPTFASIENRDLMSPTGGQDLLFILSFFVLGAWTLVDPGFHQRVASAINPDVGFKGVLVSVGFWVLSDLLLVTTGLYAIALLDPLPEHGLLIFPALGQAVLPPGLKAVFFCGMFGTILSAMVGYSLVCGGSFGRELVGRARGDINSQRVTSWTRIGIGLATALAILLAVTVDSVVGLWYSWGGAVVGALLLPVALGYSLFERSLCTSGWIIASMMASFLLSAAWLVYGMSTGNPYLEVALFEQNISLGTLIPGLLISGLIIGVGEMAARRSRT